MAKRSEAEQETRNRAFRAGMWLSRDNQRGANEGLGEREIRALEEENNTRGWGINFARDFIARRGREAEDRARGRRR